MKSQCTIYFLAILNVVCCYPSPSESDQYQKIFSTSESISPCDSTQENHFPEVSYPTKMLDTIELYYYRAADHDDILAPFSSDVKDAYNSLDDVRKCKDAHFSLPTSSEETVIIEALDGDNCKSAVRGHEDIHSINVKGNEDNTRESNVENAKDVIIDENEAETEDITSELNVDGVEHVTSVLNVDGAENVTSVFSEDGTENITSVLNVEEAEDFTTKSNVNVLEDPRESLNELNIEVPKESENTNKKLNVEKIEDDTIESSTEEADHTFSSSTAVVDTSEDVKTASNIEKSDIETDNIRTISSESSLSI